jgi:lysophospholipase L1-like esterase
VEQGGTWLGFDAMKRKVKIIVNLTPSRKKAYGLIVLVATVIVSSAGLVCGTTPGYTNIIVADDPVSFWPLNETNGTVIHDVVGTNNGAAVNALGVTLGGKGILYGQGVTSDTAVYLTNAHGGSGYINVPYPTNLTTPIFSVEAWLNMPAFPPSGAGANMNPLSFDDGPAPWGWAFEIPNPNAANPPMEGWLAGSGGWTSISAGTCLQNQWAYYVLTYDGTTFSIYTNGVLAASSSSSYTPISTSGHPLLIGGYNDGGTIDRFYFGGVENVAVYNYTLTPAQVRNHYFYGTNSGAPVIATQPASQTNYVGQTATFTASAIGVPTLSYQWKAGTTGSVVYAGLTAGAQFSAVTNSTLNITNLVLSNTADYVVVVSNSYGSVTSMPATLTVLTNTMPSIITPPASQTNNLGLTATFAVNAIGVPPLYYQWQAGATGSGIYSNLTDGSQISAVTNATLSISNLTLSNAADYVVVVSNSFGIVTSAAATLTIPSNSGSSGPPVKIMCIGDSITEIDTCYWRVDLATELVNAGYNFLMVGRNEGALGPANQRHNEGWSGYTSSEILSMIPAMMAANLPDIAMIHIGVNDLSGPYPNSTADNLTQIIQGLQSSNANMTIVVSQIIPCQLCPTVNEYDYLIPQLCQRLQTPKSHIVVADVFDGFIEDTMFDGDTGPHPNALGGQFMCNVYYPIITSILNGVIPSCAPLEPPWPGPPGYVLCSFTEGGYVVNFPTPVDIAYCANGSYFYVSNVTGNFSFNNDLGDPDPGFEKFGYAKQGGPTFTSATWLPANEVQLRLAGVPNQSYTLQICTNVQSLGLQSSTLGTNSNVPPSAFPLSPTGWVSIASTNTTTNTSFVLTDANATNAEGYYRVFVGP